MNQKNEKLHQRNGIMLITTKNMYQKEITSHEYDNTRSKEKTSNS